MRMFCLSRKVLFLLVLLCAMVQVRGEEEYPLDVIFERGIEEVQRTNEKEKELPKIGRIEDKNRADGRFGSGESDPEINRFVKILHQKQVPFEYVYDVTYGTNITNNGNSKGPVQREVEKNCATSMVGISCDPKYPYRTFNGTCNNLKNPLWGCAFYCFLRMLNPHYNGAYKFRVSVDGKPLPNPRLVSEKVHHATYPGLFAKQSHIFTMFGQQVAHDIGQTAQIKTDDNKAIQCCPKNPDVHPHCAPIEVSPDDRFYSQFNTTCMNFLRSLVCPTCTLEARHQINEVTAFIDGSAIYGRSIADADKLRNHDGSGTLRSQQTSHGELPPLVTDVPNDPCSVLNSKKCYKTGDTRTNQHSSLIAIHALFLRDHNNIARNLQEINPEWDDETLYQESRKIVVAVIQNIVYNEYLPAILPPETMSRFNLSVLKEGYTKYNLDLQPGTFAEFSTAAFRFGHSMVAQDIYNKTHGKRLRFKDDYFQVDKMQKHGLVDATLKGITKSPSEGMDRFVVPDLTDFLFKFPDADFGLDLASLDIQRGRDHGMPTYAEMYEHCSGNTLEDFRSLLTFKLMGRDVVKRLKSTYTDVNDIDLWTGILAEGKNDLLGPVGACMFGMQFHLLKYADRFYFEHGDQAGSFTEEQLGIIRQVKFSTVLCHNTKASEMPENAFFPVSESNPMVPCSRTEIKVLILPWKSHP